mgnify:CR=1 FL=1
MVDNIQVNNSGNSQDNSNGSENSNGNGDINNKPAYVEHCMP